MDTIEALNSRFTARAFKPDPVDHGTLEKVMEAALRAPSWANTQPWEVYLAGGEVLNRLREAYVANLKNCVARNLDLAAPKPSGRRRSRNGWNTLPVRTFGDP